MNIIYMGTPDFAVPTLETLIKSEHDVKLVVTQPDRPRGRKKTPMFSPVKEVAVRENIDVYQPEKIKNENLDILKKYEPDVIVVVAFGQILSKDILELPKYGCINVHASLLPDYRGAAPIQWAVINGDEKTGVTIMQMDEGLDTGDILAVKEIQIADDETGGSLFDKLSLLGGDILLKVLQDAEDGKLSPVKQGESKTGYAKMLKKEMGEIDFSKSSDEILRLVRGLYPWPGTYTFVNGKMLKIMNASLSENAEALDALPGTVVNSKKKLEVKTGDGVICLNEVQLEGKKRMQAADFLRGYEIPEGTVLKRQ